jgi:hypothetical protein
MTTQLLMQRDVAGENTFGLIPTDKKFKNILAVGVAKTVTVPTDANKFLAIFSSQPGTSVWWALNATATLPTAGEFVASNAEQDPSSWVVENGDTISAITNSATAEVGVKFYAIS